MVVRIKANPLARINIVPVDYVARAIADTVEQDKEGIIYAIIY